MHVVIRTIVYHDPPAIGITDVDNLIGGNDYAIRRIKPASVEPKVYG